MAASGKLLALARIFAFNRGSIISDGDRNHPVIQMKRNITAQMMKDILNDVRLTLETLSCTVIFYAQFVEKEFNRICSQRSCPITCTQILKRGDRS